MIRGNVENLEKLKRCFNMCFSELIYKDKSTILATCITNITPWKRRAHQDLVEDEVESGDAVDTILNFDCEL